MRTLSAAVGTAVFALTPATVAGAIPRYLSGWEMQGPFGHGWPLRTFGAVLIAAGAGVLIAAFVRFVAEGVGTPAPVAPTAELVVGGLYRYVRNPMYIAVVTTIVGQSMFLGQLDLAVYAAIAWMVMAAFAAWYETPALTRQFGDAYDEYRRRVPAWFPRCSRNIDRRPESRSSEL
jgi:protein-S-isoprenylcysteine O-methyltransferase Ste14